MGDESPNAAKSVTPAELKSPGFDTTLRQLAQTLKSELIRQTIEDGQSYMRAMYQQWNLAHPNEGWYDPSNPKWDKEIKQFEENVRGNYYNWVIPSFEKLVAPDPDANNAPIETLQKIRGDFTGHGDGKGGVSLSGGALSRIGDVRGEMVLWKGDFQVTFVDRFARPLETVSYNQGIVTQAAIEILQINKILYIHRRARTLDLLKKGIEAVKVLKQGKSPKSFTWGTLVITSVGTILALSNPAAGALLQVAGTLAQGMTPSTDAGPGMELSAPTAQEVASKILDALNTLINNHEQSERSLDSAIRECCDTISDARTPAILANRPGPLSIPVPDIATTDDPNPIRSGKLVRRH